MWDDDEGPVQSLNPLYVWIVRERLDVCLQCIYEHFTIKVSGTAYGEEELLRVPVSAVV